MRVAGQVDHARDLPASAELAGSPDVLVDAKRLDAAQPLGIVGAPVGFGHERVPQRVCQSTPRRRASALTVVSSSDRGVRGLAPLLQ